MSTLVRHMSATAFLIAICFSQIGYSQQNNSSKLSVSIPRITEPPAFKDFQNMTPTSSLAKQMALVTGFIQREPSDGEPSSQKTEVYLGYDERNLYVFFLAFDNEPEKVRASMSRRENLFNDDIVEIMIDTFHDQRRAYAFVCNPLGVQWDAIWTEGQGFDESFDTVWQSEGEKTENGYIVRMQIPFKSLRFKSADEQEWGLIFVREIRRASEQSFWPHVSSTVEGRLNQAGMLHGLNNISAGRNVQLIPYSTYRSFRLLDRAAPEFIEDNFDATAGLDAKLVLKDKFTLDLTANPDFNQVESDRPQVTVNQRFEVFFPEKRPFFLENANYFNTPTTLVFTRRIADPRFGVRLTGKTGPLALGALISDDEAPGKQVDTTDPLSGKKATFAVGRLNLDVLNQSNVGLTFTDREFGDGYNRVLGFDTRFKISQNWIASGQFVRSSTKDQQDTTKTGTGLDLVLNRSGRRLNIHNHLLQYSPDFETQMGFVPRIDMRNLHQNIDYKFRPEGKFLISWGPDFTWIRIWDFEETTVEESYFSSLEFEFGGQTEVELYYNRIKELLRPADFATLPGNRNFDQETFEVLFKSDFLDAVNFETRVELGTAVNFRPVEGAQPSKADRAAFEFELALKPAEFFRIENEYFITRLADPASGAKIFTNHLFQSRWNWQINRKLSLRLIVDYEANLTNQTFTSQETEKRLNGDFLLTYLVNPWTALYVGTNRNYRNDRLNPDSRLVQISGLRNDSRQFFIKYSHLLRL